MGISLTSNYFMKHAHKHDCEKNYYGEFLCSAAPDFLWYCVQDVGSYQGQVFGIATYKGKVGIYEDYYGSCSGCGAWGEGGEPEKQQDVIDNATLFNDREAAIAHIDTLEEKEDLDRKKFEDAIYDAFADLTRNDWSDEECHCLDHFTKRN